MPAMPYVHGIDTHGDDGVVAGVTPTFGTVLRSGTGNTNRGASRDGGARKIPLYKRKQEPAQSDSAGEEYET